MPYIQEKYRPLPSKLDLLPSGRSNTDLYQSEAIYCTTKGTTCKRCTCHRQGFEMRQMNFECLSSYIISYIALYRMTRENPVQLIWNIFSRDILPDSKKLFMALFLNYSMILTDFRKICYRSVNLCKKSLRGVQTSG